MFDLFGMSKADTQEAIKALAAGVTKGLIESYTWELAQKDIQIAKLTNDIQENEVWKSRYYELSRSIELHAKDKKSKEDKKNEPENTKNSSQ